MPRIAALFAPREQLDTLLGRQMTPEIARLGHGRSLTEPPEGGTPNFAGASEFRFCFAQARTRELTRQDRLGPSKLAEGGTPNFARGSEFPVDAADSGR